MSNIVVPQDLLQLCIAEVWLTITDEYFWDSKLGEDVLLKELNDGFSAILLSSNNFDPL